MLFDASLSFHFISYFLFIGAHDGSVLSCTAGTYGSCNDKTLIRFDEYINEIRSDIKYTKIEYELMVSETESIMQKGVYSIVDGGYHHWVSTMSTSRLPTNPDFVAWRKQLESVRKDIEDIFGVIKGRFRICKLPVLFHYKEQIDNMVHTCVGLHNMLHAWDERDIWVVGVRWGEKDGQFDDGGGGMYWGKPKIRRANGKLEHVIEGEDFSRCGRMSFGDQQVPLTVNDMPLINIDDIDIDKLVERHTERDSKFFVLQNKLVKNFNVQKNAGRIQWLRSL